MENTTTTNTAHNVGTEVPPDVSSALDLTVSEKYKILVHPLTVTIMLAFPILSYLTAANLLNTMNPTDQFGFLFSINNFWGNMALLTLMLLTYGLFTFLAAVENANDITTGLFKAYKDKRYGFKLLWDISQTMGTYYFTWLFSDDLGAAALIIGIIIFGVTEGLESIWFKTSLFEVIGILMKKTMIGRIVAGITALVTMVTVIQAIDVFTRWHIVYGEEIIPTEKIYKLPGSAAEATFEFRKSGSGRVPTVHPGIERYMCKVHITFHDINITKSYAIITDQQVFSEDIMREVLSGPLYVCKGQKSSRQAQYKGINVILSFEPKVPEAPPQDFFE